MVVAEFVSNLRNTYGIEFKNLALLDEAFTHSSYANEHRELGISDNERLEFLGDAVLELTVSDYLYRKYPEEPEGKLTRMRAAIVQTRSFSAFSREAHFDRYIKLGNGEEAAGARKRNTLLEDLFEAFCGALYLDQGRGAVISFCEKIIFPKIDAGEFLSTHDFKTALQEELQRSGDAQIEYELLSTSGPANARIFTVRVLDGKKELGTGTGKSKKAAEQEAAKAALTTIRADK
ncbi:ribonuclease III [Lacticaseibacillus zhaodongensis]|uniref:ribonuclease III n=1 Tax=Lacticaseibacillus zhaodongensis TaxID=2668065 RepID=UPI0012D3678B|nr:ribonuclease III [Lacticaseibacillus zhaodongensis]